MSITKEFQVSADDPVAQEKVVQEKGMHLLTRIRQIEAECLEQHGEFDWEKLPEDVQDEYDGLCFKLDELRGLYEGGIPLRDLLRRESETSSP